MTTQTLQPAPSPLLTLLKNRQPGDIHSVAAKAHLLSGFEECKGNTLKNAEWNEDRTVLIVTFTGGQQTTLLVDGVRLMTKCSCHVWQPARNCPHVVIAWATLKRVISPETLSHIQFNRQMLLDMKDFIDRQAIAGDDKTAGETSGQSQLKQNLSDARRFRNEQINKEKLATAATTIGCRRR